LFASVYYKNKKYEKIYGPAVSIQRE